MSRCAPKNAKYTSMTDTCFSPKDIVDIAQKVNLIQNDKESSITGMNIFILTRILHSYFGTQLGDERKWLNDERIPSQYLNAFRDQWSDGKPHNLLDTNDIMNVLKQYEEVYDFFKFMGVEPIDFNSSYKVQSKSKCIAADLRLCDLSLKTLNDMEKTDFGIVINLDTHNNPGSHWVACYGSIDKTKEDKFGIFYFDSIGNTPPEQIQTFMKSIATNVTKETGVKFPISYNRKKIQRGNTECGIYCIVFICNCLSTTYNYATICDLLPNDDFISHTRDFILTIPVQRMS